MRKIYFFILFLLFLVGPVLAQGETVKGYYVIYDAQAPFGDITSVTKISSDISLETGTDFEILISSDLTRSKLENSVSVFVYSGNAIVILNDNAPSSDIELGTEIEGILNTEGLPHAIVFVSEITSLDLIEAINKANLKLIEEDVIEGPTLNETETIPKPIELEPVEEPVDIPQEKDIEYICNGCESDDKCYPFGFRKGGSYCSDIAEDFRGQKEAEAICENNFECESNVCISGQCISPGLIERILNWFRRLFG